MKTVTVLIALSFLAVTAKCEKENPDKSIVCYRAGFPSGNRGGYNGNCTHVMFKVGVVDAWKGYIKENSTGRIKKLKARNPNHKHILHLDPLNHYPMDNQSMYHNRRLPQVIDSKVGRARLVKSALWVLKHQGYDGLDLEFNSMYFHQLALMVADMRKEFDKHGYILSALFPKKFTEEDIDEQEFLQVAENLDFINVISFKTSRTSNATELTAPLHGDHGSSVDKIINWYIDKGVPKNKILMGIQTYGVVHVLENADNYQIGSPSYEVGNKDGHIELSKIKGDLWEFYRDSETVAPYAVNYLKWVSYEDEISVSTKVEYIKQNELGGAALFAADCHDDLSHNLPFLNILHRMFTN